MKNLTQSLLLLLAIALALPVQAQFRGYKRTADKEFELKAYNLAIESYKQALARRPNDLESLSRIADSYRMLNQMQTANQYYQQAVRNKRVTGETVLAHAKNLKALGRYDAAKQFFLLYARDFDGEVTGNHYAQSCDFALRQLNVDAGFVVQPATINSPVADFGPTLPQPTQLVFNSARAEAGTGFDGEARNQPYVAAIGPDGKPLEAFALITGYTSDAGNVGPVSYSPDGTQVVFTRNNFTSGTRMVPEAGLSLNLFIADVNQQGTWTNARPLPFNGTDFSTGFGTFSNDGNSIYFASDRPEGYGGYDVYRANRRGQSWEQVPENLGTVINSVGNEITPYFDGASLYFSSDWHHGMGTYDVFRSEMAAGRPTRLYHMGNGINSNRDDYGFVYDPVTNSGYVVSNRIGGSGQEDIYTVGRTNANMVLVVNSAVDGSPIPNAAVDFTSCGGQVYAADINGRYVFQSVEGLNCDIIVGATGFDPVRIPLQSMQPDANNVVRVTLNAGSGGLIPGGPTGPSAGVPNGVAPGGPVPPGSVRGYVANAQDGYPVMDAQVTITKRSTGQSASIRTNQDGAYFVAVEPNTTYDVSINAFGFEPLTYPVQVNDGTNPDAFGLIELLPSQGSGGGPIGGPAPPGATVQGFAVQMSSVSKAPTDLSQFNNVSNLGRVYSLNDGGSYKIRLGVFPTRAEADAAAAAVKQAGYSGAFVVADSGPAALGGSTAPPVTNQPYTPSPGPVTQPTAGSSQYKVQIIASGKPENFDRTKASQLGVVESVRQGNLTKFMIGGLNSLAEAENVRARAQALGYAGAFILQNVNGSLQRL